MEVSATGARAAELFDRQGLLCAESVLTALAERYGLESDLIPRMASGFCSGVSRTGNMCGALSGAVLALGLLHGRDSGAESLEVVYALVQEVVGEFADRFGETTCMGLLGVDFRTPEGQSAFKERNMKLDRCVPMARAAAEISARVLDDFAS